MTTTMDYYEILGVDKNASEADIKRAFRKKARQLHPDVSKEPDAEEKFKELGKAYETLADSEKRSMYDRYGEDGLKNAGFDPHGPFDFGFGDLSEILSSFFGGGMGGGFRSNPNAPQRGSDLRLDLEVEFEEAVFGVEKDIEIDHLKVCEKCSGSGIEPGSKPVTCPTCNGAGQVQRVTQTMLGHFSQVSTCPECNGSGQKITNPCKGCHGKGRKNVSKVINIKIPAGIDNGTKLRVNQEGDAGKNGGPYGDLYVVLFVKPHEIFKRDGVNIHIDKKISFAQAALGEELVVPTINGDQKIKITAGTQSETVITIKEAGIPYLGASSRKGNQYVKVIVETPKHLSEEERKLYKKLLEIEKEKSNKDSLLDKVKDVFSGATK